MKKIVCLAILIFLLFPFNPAFAKDTDIYVLDQTQKQIYPDALIILDLSLTMDFPPPGGVLYSSHATSGCTSYDGPFYDAPGTGHTTACTWTAQQAASSPHWGNSTSCAGPFYKTNGTKSGVAFNTDCSRVEIAKRAISTFLDADGSGTVDSADETALKMRVGYMRFDRYCTGITEDVGTAFSTINSTVSGETVGTYTALVDALTKGKTYYTNQSDDAKACRQKFVILITDGEDSMACGGPVVPPNIDDYARRREVVARAKALADAQYKVFVVGFGGDMPHYLKNTLNWMAYYGGTDNPTVSNPTITSKYTILSGSNHLYPTEIENLITCLPNTPCTKDSACKKSTTHQCSTTSDGSPTHWYACVNSSPYPVYHDPGEMTISGYAFLATSATDLAAAITAIRTYIIAYSNTSTSYVAPVVPISQFEKTSSENSMYLGMFKPTNTRFWYGNIKKYGIATAKTDTLQVGDIIDSQTPPQAVMDTSNKIRKEAKSYWSSVADGGEVDKGAVGERLLARVFDNDLLGNPRKIYTLLGTNPDLTASANGFNLSNKNNIPLGTLSVSTDSERQDIIRYIHGLNPYNEITTRTENDGKRDWILGSLIHSRPAVVHYSDKDVIYAGANDGMLHAFDNDTGNELWAFIPPDLLPKLKNFNDPTQGVQFFVDGSPKVYEDASGKILIFGLRRGGSRYYALKVTDHDSPQFLWYISATQRAIVTGGTISTSPATDYGKLGQTWSTPGLAKIKNGGGGKWVAFIGGGYDEKEDPGSTTSATQGMAIYVVDISDGSLVKSFSASDSGCSSMTRPIPSDIACVDIDGDGFIDRLYVGDLGGRMWRFDIGDFNDRNDPAKWKGKVVYSGGGKIFYPPDVTLQKDNNGNYEMLFFGTGDRENPKDTGFTNTLYAIKDRNGSTLSESDLKDVTVDILQDPTASDSDKNKVLSDLNTMAGWFIKLNQNSGEKCLAGAVVFDKAAYYTTYTPPATQQSGDPCSIGAGKARIYIVDYLTGNAVFNLDSHTGIEGSDRSMEIGAGIPSGVIISIISDTAVAYSGVGGGVYSPDLVSGKVIVPVNWRLVF
jgi:hypothetical protein